MSNDWFYRYQTTILAVVLVFVPIVVICIIFITALACSEYWSRRRGCSFSHFTCICGLRRRSQRRRNHSNTDDVNSSERAESSRTSAENKNQVSGTELSLERPVALRTAWDDIAHDMDRSFRPIGRVHIISRSIQPYCAASPEILSMKSSGNGGSNKLADLPAERT